MTPLAKRRTKLSFITSDEVREQGRSRQVVIEAHPGYAVVRLAGLRRSYSLSYGAIYQLAVKAAVAAERAEKKTRHGEMIRGRKAVGGSP